MILIKQLKYYCLALFFIVTTVSANNKISSVINYVLFDEQPHLQKVLTAYQNPDSSHVFIAAHRGGREFDKDDNAPGNSIANIENAVSKGFDLYESDISILGNDGTGALIVFHDQYFEDLTNSTIQDDLLIDRDLAYAKSLFLTYKDGTVSDQKIPTLEEFLLAGKDKIMFKFDLKEGTFSKQVLLRIFATVVATDTVDQVLIRGGNHVLTTAHDNGYDTRMVMRKFDSVPAIDDINDLVANYNVRAISIPTSSNATTDVLSAANTAGLIVEVHEAQVDTNDPDWKATLEQDWQNGISKGIRQFHSFKPLLLKTYLETNNKRDF